MDYLTKWPEVFSTADQSAATVADLSVREVVSQYGIPAELFSDRGKTFQSRLMSKVYKLLGNHKVNITAYHSQTINVDTRGVLGGEVPPRFSDSTLCSIYIHGNNC